jgi:hypothetical protein
VTLREACERIIDTDDLALCECSYVDLGLTGPELNTLMDDAANALARLTHLPVGRCTTTYRPCRRGCSSFYCGCCGPSGIPLPGLNPTVTSVKIDGVTVATNEYTVIRTANNWMLERFDPVNGYPAVWPHSQNIAAPDTMAGTFAITVTSGTYSDYLLRNAIGEIACDILSHLNAERETDEGAIAATGYGVSLSYVRFGDPTDQETRNLAGLSWVRRFVASYGGGRSSALWSPELDEGWILYDKP